MTAIDCVRMFLALVIFLLLCLMNYHTYVRAFEIPCLIWTEIFFYCFLNNTIGFKKNVNFQRCFAPSTIHGRNPFELDLAAT